MLSLQLGMPFRKRFIKRQTRNKGHLQHSSTVIQSLGPASAPIEFQIIETDVGARTVDGSQQIATAERNTGDNCNVGDLIKYVNIFIEAGVRTDESAQANGWLEYAVQWGKADDTAIPITNLGTQTLGTICARMFPQNTLLTGFIPLGKNQPNGAQLHIKMPRKCQYLKTGDMLRLWTSYRTSSSTETGTTQIRAVVSFLYNGYY